MPHTDILSPHYDDAALSSWHQIEQPDTRIVTVFAGVPENSKRGVWDGFSTHSSGEETVSLRQRENQQALQGTTATALDLPYLDRQYAPFKTRDITEISETIKSYAADTTTFVAAAGIGRYFRNHPDHVTTRQVALDLLKDGYDVSFYADIPYMLPISTFNNWPERISVEKLKRTLGIDVAVESHELSPEQQLHKQIAVRAFSSQFPMVNTLAGGALSKKDAYRWEAIIRPV